MNRLSKRLLLGLLIWIIPFVTSFFIWDITLNGPVVPTEWFNAIMAFTWAIGFSIAAFIYFRDEKGSHEGWITGITWYLQLVILDIIVLVGIFEMSLANFFPLVLTYLNTLVISVVIGSLTE